MKRSTLLVMNKGKRYVLSVIVLFAIALLILPSSSSAISEEQIRAVMQDMNEQLEDMGKNFRVGAVEYFTAGEYNGQIVYFDDHMLQLGHQFVPGDPRRPLTGILPFEITWLSDLTEGTADGTTFAETQSAVASAMATWGSEYNCATIPLTQLPDLGLDWGFVQWLAGYGGSPGWLADITQAGWLPGGFFDLLAPGGSNYILGATFIFIWQDEAGTIVCPGCLSGTDIDNDGKLDTAFTEKYFNNSLPWGINTKFPFDVETVVLHENGHSLGLGHFGKLFQTPNGLYHFSPRALMNAGYTGQQQDLTATDMAAMCSIWANWPNN